jgi:hypothetical protein
MANDIIGLVREGTKRWTRTKKAEERNPASRAYRMTRMTRERGVSFKEAAWEVMQTAYMQASGNGALPAHARQVMYAARRHIQKATGKQLDDNYFTQTLLPDYVEESDVDWDIVYDARGHFQEPHGGESFGIGTLEVRAYLAKMGDVSILEARLSQAKIELHGPSGNFGGVLFIEKEGFMPLLRAAQIAEKFDLALMSTKGMSVVAARALADQMCDEHDIPLWLLHDFDKAGFSIAGTLQRDTRRYEFENDIRVIDLGLSLADVQAMGLEHEYQHHPKANKNVLIANLRENGATDEEIQFMFHEFDALRSTRRVELNAMTSPQFVAFVERKLRENSVSKVVPSGELLAKVYTAVERGRRLEEAIKGLNIVDAKSIEPPSNLEEHVRNLLQRQPTMRWYSAVAKVVAENKDQK